MELCFRQREKCNFAGGDKNVANYTPTFEIRPFSDKKTKKQMALLLSVIKMEETP